MFTTFIPGLPVGQPRPRAVSFRGKARMYNPSTADTWKACVIKSLSDAIADGRLKKATGAVRVDLYFALPRPKSHFRTGRNAGQLKPDAPSRHTCKPDLDNLTKAAMDAMTAAGVWVDDGQVAMLGATKKYDDNPGLSLCIKEAVA